MFGAFVAAITPLPSVVNTRFVAAVLLNYGNAHLHVRRLKRIQKLTDEELKEAMAHYRITGSLKI